MVHIIWTNVSSTLEKYKYIITKIGFKFMSIAFITSEYTYFSSKMVQCVSNIMTPILTRNSLKVNSIPSVRGRFLGGYTH